MGTWWVNYQKQGDFNPVHLDKEYASKSRYKKQIIHGMMAQMKSIFILIYFMIDMVI